MKINRIKVLATVVFAVPVIAVTGFRAEVVKVSAADGDVAAEYKAKCAACHTPTASKFYNPAMTEEEQIQVILKGKKGEKPPYMPGFEAKGMTAEQAKAMADYMKTLHPAAPAN